MESLLAHTKLVHHVARNWIASFERAGLGVEYEDLVQEGFVVCINAEKKFDKAQGWAFSTYFVTCANHHYSAMHKRMRGSSAISLDALTEDNLSLLDTLEDPSENPELELVANLELRNAIDDLPALAKAMLSLLIDPPSFVKEQFEAIEAKRQLARQQGVDERHPPEINLAFISSLFAAAGIRAKDLAIAREQIRELEAAHAV